MTFCSPDPGLQFPKQRDALQMLGWLEGVGRSEHFKSFVVHNIFSRLFCSGQNYVALMDTELPQLGEEIRPRYRCGVSPQYRHPHPRHLFLRHHHHHHHHHHLVIITTDLTCPPPRRTWACCGSRGPASSAWWWGPACRWCGTAPGALGRTTSWRQIRGLTWICRLSGLLCGENILIFVFMDYVQFSWRYVQ